MARTNPTPCLISVNEAAILLSVSPRTVLGWIDDDSLPHVELSTGTAASRYRLPLHGLVRSLPELYDLAAEFREADDVVSDPTVEEPELYELGMDVLTTVAATTWHAAELAPPVGAMTQRARALQRYVHPLI